MTLGFITLATPICRVAGQTTRLQLMAGISQGFVSSNGNSATYKPLSFPSAALRCMASINPRVSFVSGIGYEQKGFRSRSEILFPPPNEEFADVYESQTRYEFISIPLQVGVRIVQRSALGLVLEGGMNYGFMLNAKSDWDMYSYRSGALVNHNVFVSRPRIALLPRDSRVAPAAGASGDLYLFHPAVTLAATLAVRRRYVLRAFYERNLYDASSGPALGRLRLQTAGIMAGIAF